MDAVEQVILTTIDNNGGRVAYDTVYNAVPADQRRYIPRVMKDLKSRGIAMNQNQRTEDGQLEFVCFRLQPVTGGQ